MTRFTDVRHTLRKFVFLFLITGQSLELYDRDRQPRTRSGISFAQQRSTRPLQWEGAVFQTVPCPRAILREVTKLSLTWKEGKQSRS